MENTLQKAPSDRFIYYLSVLGFFGIFSTTISKNPVLPLFVHSLGGNEEIIGFISAVSPLAGIIFSFPVGFLIHKIGQRTLFTASAGFFIFAPLLYIVVNNPWWLIPIRFFHGFATAILMPLVSTVIFHNYPNSKGEKLGVFSSSTLIGRAAAPLVGGSVIALFSYLNGFWNYRLVYVLAFLSALPMVLIIRSLRLKDEVAEEGQIQKKFSWKEMGQALNNFLIHRRLLSTAILEMSTYFIFGVLETFLPIYLHDNNYSAFSIGLIFTAQILAIAFSKPFFGKTADKKDKRPLIILGSLIMGVSMVCLPFFTNYFIIFLLSILFGLGMSFSTISTNSYAGDIVKKEDLGSSMGALSSIMDIGHSFGPLITGLIIVYSSLTYGFLFSLVIILGAVFFFVMNNFVESNKEINDNNLMI